MGLAAFLGALWVPAHLLTVAVTVSVDGAAWRVTAWGLDLAGFVAGACFAILCRVSATRTPVRFRKQNSWILAWSVITLDTRVLDTLMLTGLVPWGAVYETPVGPTLWANLFS